MGSDDTLALSVSSMCSELLDCDHIYDIFIRMSKKDVLGKKTFLKEIVSDFFITGSAGFVRNINSVIATIQLFTFSGSCKYI